MSLFFVLCVFLCFSRFTCAITSARCSTVTSARCTTSSGESIPYRNLPDGGFQSMSGTVTGLSGHRGAHLDEISLSWYLPDPVLSNCSRPVTYTGFNLTFEGRDNETLVKSALSTIFTISLDPDPKLRQISVNITSRYFTRKVYIKAYVTTNFVSADHCSVRQARTDIFERVINTQFLHDFNLTVSPETDSSVSIWFCPLNLSEVNTVAVCDDVCPSCSEIRGISHRLGCWIQRLQKMNGYLKIADVKCCHTYSIQICPADVYLASYCNTFFLPNTEFPCTQDEVTKLMSSNTLYQTPSAQYSSRPNGTHLKINYSTTFQTAIVDQSTKGTHGNIDSSEMVSAVTDVTKANDDVIPISAGIASLVATALVIAAAAVVVKQRSKRHSCSMAQNGENPCDLSMSRLGTKGQVINEAQVVEKACDFNISNCAILDGSVGIILFFCSGDVDEVGKIVCACHRNKIVLNHVDICDETFTELLDFKRLGRHHSTVVFIGSWMMVRVLEARRTSTSGHAPVDTVKLVKRHFARSYLLCLNTTVSCIGRLQTLLNVSAEHTFLFSNNDPSISKLLKDVLFSPPDDPTEVIADSDEDIFVELEGINYRSSWP